MILQSSGRKIFVFLGTTFVYEDLQPYDKWLILWQASKAERKIPVPTEHTIKRQGKNSVGQERAREHKKEARRESKCTYETTSKIQRPLHAYATRISIKSIQNSKPRQESEKSKAYPIQKRNSTLNQQEELVFLIAFSRRKNTSLRDILFSGSG